MFTHHNNKSILRSTKVYLLGVGILSLASTPASADDYVTQFEIAEFSVQPPTPVFKFQARVNQAKMPVGEAEFPEVLVQLKSGDTVLCQETYDNVRVSNSIINLSIGHTTSCAMEDIVAEYSDLQIQVCLGQGNCLKDIDLGTVPYAVKAAVAVEAQDASRAEQAAQAHYAHRITADRDLLTSAELGTGYYDFHTPAALPDPFQLPSVEHTTDAGTPAEYYGFAPMTTSDGYMSWTPITADDATDGESRNLSIALKDADTDTLEALTSLFLHAENVVAREDLVVLRDMQVGGRSQFHTGVYVGEPDFLAPNVPLPEEAEGFVCTADASFFGNVDFNGVVDFADAEVQGLSSVSLGATNIGSGSIHGSASGYTGNPDDPSDPLIHISEGSIGGQDIHEQSISGSATSSGTVHIETGSIGSADIADEAITGDQIADDAIDTRHIAYNAVTSSHIRDYAIFSNHIANDSIHPADLGFTRYLYALKDGQTRDVQHYYCSLVHNQTGNSTSNSEDCTLTVNTSSQWYDRGDTYLGSEYVLYSGGPDEPKWTFTATTDATCKWVCF